MKNKIQILQSLKKLVDLFESGQIQTLSVHELYPDLPLSSRERYLYFTLAPALNFQRNSPALWRSAFSTYQDTETRFVFLPEVVAKKSEEELRTALLKHRLALQPNKHVQIWKRISHTFCDKFSSDPRVFLQANDYDVVKIIDSLQNKFKKDFPYLSGIKLSNYWLFILSKFTDAKFKNMQQLSIIPDTHIIQSSIKLGIVEESADSKQVDLVWRSLLKDTDFSPAELHTVLWNWSRAGFEPGVR